MKKLVLFAMMLFGAFMVTSTPASAQVYVGIGNHGVRVGVGVGVYGPRYYPQTCRDYYGRPVYCNPAPVYDYDYGYGYGYGYGCDHGYDCGPVNYGGFYYSDRYPRYYNYNRSNHAYWRNDFGRGRGGDWNRGRGGDWNRGHGGGGAYRHR